MKRALNDLLGLFKVIFKDSVDVILIVFMIFGVILGADLLYWDKTICNIISQGDVKNVGVEDFYFYYIFIIFIFITALLRMAWFKRAYHDLLKNK